MAASRRVVRALCLGLCALVLARAMVSVAVAEDADYEDEDADEVDCGLSLLNAIDPYTEETTSIYSLRRFFDDMKAAHAPGIGKDTPGNDTLNNGINGLRDAISGIIAADLHINYNLQQLLERVNEVTEMIDQLDANITAINMRACCTSFDPCAPRSFTLFLYDPEPFYSDRERRCVSFGCVTTCLPDTVSYDSDTQCPHLVLSGDEVWYEEQ